MFSTFTSKGASVGDAVLKGLAGGVKNLRKLMKILIWYGVTASILGSAAAILGQNEITSSSSSSYVPMTKLVGRKIKSSEGEEIGVIKDVVLDGSNGCMAYTLVSTGEARMGGGRIVVVPWAVYSPTSDLSVLRVNVDQRKIYNAPEFNYTRMDEYARPDYINNIYSYYGISPGTRGGVSASSGATAGTDVTGTAGATATPGEVASPTAARIVSPNNKASARAHATAEAGHDDTARKNGSREASRSERARRQPPTDREEGASSTTREDSLSERTTSPSESNKSQRKGSDRPSTGTPSETPHSTDGDE